MLYVFRLAEAAADGFSGMARKMVNLEQYGGLVVWETAISMIEGEAENWDRLIALRFETVERAESWLRDPVSVTERAIARRNMQQVVVLLLQGVGRQGVGGSPRRVESDPGRVTADAEQSG